MQLPDQLTEPADLSRIQSPLLDVAALDPRNRAVPAADPGAGQRDAVRSAIARDKPGDVDSHPVIMADVEEAEVVGTPTTAINGHTYTQPAYGM
jgi:hypothetical protein